MFVLKYKLPEIRRNSRINKLAKKIERNQKETGRKRETIMLKNTRFEKKERERIHFHNFIIGYGEMLYTMAINRIRNALTQESIN